MFAISHPQRAPGAKPRTFDETRNLPKLPIPTLQSSLDRYVTSLRPFLLESNELDKGLEERRELARSFAEDGLGIKLQERLKGKFSVRSRSSRWGGGLLSIELV